MKLATRYIEQGRSEGDPRFLGQAQAVLSPWWSEPTPPPAALLLRATIRQNAHEFNEALADLERYWPYNRPTAQAWLTKASILQVQARYDDARRACRRLARLAASHVLLVSLPAWAHKPSDSYLSLTVQNTRIDGRWDIALRDLADAIGLDGDGNGRLTWGEVRKKHDEIGAYALSRLMLSTDTCTCATHVLEQLIDHHTDGAYSVLRFHSEVPRSYRTAHGGLPASVRYRCAT